MNKKGFVLIFALWVLAVLTVLAVSVASGIRQKIILVQKLDERSRMRYVLESAAARTKNYVRMQLAQAGAVYTASMKTNVHNNPMLLSSTLVGDDQGVLLDVTDEERKINVNTTSVPVLARLLERVLGLKLEQAAVLARSILDWRQSGTSEADGFFSDEYYNNLQYPFHKKDAPYEVLDELLLVKGVSKDIYERILPFVTVYGQGQVNINTAPAQVLYALGLEDSVTEKLLNVRRGQDGIEATPDDHIFDKTFDVASEVNMVLKLDLKEIRAIEALNLQGILTVASHHFSMLIEGRLAKRESSRQLHVVFDAAQNRILYWKEK